MANLAFSTLGFLIGTLMGLSADSVVKSIIPLLFAFGGGSAVGFLHKLEDKFRITAYQLIFALSISCLIGAFSGIIISEYQLLTPIERRHKRLNISIKESKYLFSQKAISAADTIDQLYANNTITVEEAYEKLYQIINKENE